MKILKKSFQLVVRCRMKWASAVVQVKGLFLGGGGGQNFCHFFLQKKTLRLLVGVTYHCITAIVANKVAVCTQLSHTLHTVDNSGFRFVH